MNLFEMIPMLGDIQEKAPQILSEFLDKLLKEHKDELRPDEGEKQMFYIMFPKKNGDKIKYMISIVALDENDTIKRLLKTISMDEALKTIFSQI